MATVAKIYFEPIQAATTSQLNGTFLDVTGRSV